MEAIHILALDIYNAKIRNCKPYQEQIVDSFDDGKLKVAWDIIKENYFLRGDEVLEQICDGCPLNIYTLQQGCQGEIFNLNLLLNYLKINSPDSPLLEYNFTDAKLSFAEVQEIKQELEEISSNARKNKWPAACVYYEGNPVTLPARDEKEEPYFYPWAGEEEKLFAHGNEAYRFCVRKEGIVIQRSLVEIPHTFIHLWKKEGKTFGKTTKDEVIVFEKELGIFPSWDTVDNERESELIFKEINSDIVLRYVMDTLKAFLDTAAIHHIGLNVSEVL
ncbi:MAG: hypothetical protein ABIH00_02135 [Armatimonadota bacterium]